MATARPKSPIRAVPSEVSQTLPGFRSRWTMPLEWANSRPRAHLHGQVDSLLQGEPVILGSL